MRAIVHVAALLLAADAGASGFSARDQNPFLSGFGLPAHMPADTAAAGEWSLAADFNWASTALIQRRGNESLVVDAETRDVRLTFGRGLTDRIELRLQVPYRSTSAGELDSFIDGWHELFGLPEGARKDLPDDQLRIAYTRDGIRVFDVASSLSGIADLSVDLGYQLRRQDRSSATAWLSLKLPTGDADELTGSGAVDVAATIAAEQRWSERWIAYGQAGVVWLGEGDLLPDQQRSVAWSAIAGIGWQLAKSLQLKAQIDAHSGVFDATELDFLGPATILTVGGEYRFASGWEFDIGISEDLIVESAADVVFVVGVRKR